MQVKFKSNQKLGNKDYKAGEQVVPDHLSANVKFKALVKTGQVIVLARTKSAQEIQANKDLQNAKKAQSARVMTKKLADDKAAKVAAAAAEAAAKTEAKA